MNGRRIAAMLCVLLGHAFIVFALLNLTHPDMRPTPRPVEEFASLVFFIEEDEFEEVEDPVPAPAANDPPAPRLPADAAESPDESVAARAPEAEAERGFIDWPVEARESAKRVLAAEREAERVARMFAGPGGTWSSLTKRQRDELNHFRWAPGVDGLERSDTGEFVYRMKNGCVLVNFLFFGCPIGKKPPPYGDLFKDMRLYFDEQRRPQTTEGNGTEPESKRPPRWSKPLPDNRPRPD